MLHRPHNLVSFIRNVTCRYHADRSCIFQIGLIRRHSILIVPKYGTRCKVHAFSNSQKIFAKRAGRQDGDCRWTCATRFSSDDAKSNGDKSEVKLAEEVQQRIIELNEEKLGKLKERALNVEPVISNEKKEEKEQAAKLAEKQSAESKESKDDIALKKGRRKKARE